MNRERTLARAARALRLLLAVALLLGIGAGRAHADMAKADVEKALADAYAKYKGLKEGANADYIPALAKVDPELFGIALVTADGKVYTTGDVDDRSLDPVDLEGVHDGAGDPGAGDADASRTTSASTRPGRCSTRSSRSSSTRAHGDEPAGQSGRDRDHQHGQGRQRDAIWKKIIGDLQRLRRPPAEVNQEVYKSEADTNQRNQAIGMLMYAYGHIKDNRRQARDIYTRQCSVASMRRTSRRWPRRSPTAARIRSPASR